MSRTLSFREMVKLIHPDHNPNVVDAGGKMATAVLYKNQPEELYKLAIRWGFVNQVSGGNPEPTPRPTPRPQPRRRPQPRPDHVDPDFGRWQTPPPPRFEWRAYFNDTPQVGDNVCVTTLEGARVEVVRTTPKRVYFYHNGRRTYASKDNVYVVRKVQI